MAEHQIPPNAGSDRPLCFAMMPFEPLFDEYHRTVFVPAIEDAGLTARRSDDVNSHHGTVSGDIRTLVMQSAVCMADLTGSNLNVLYEIGLAHGLDKPVVLLAQSPEDVPMELHGRRIVYYRTELPDWAQTLRVTLGESLRQTVVDGVSVVPVADRPSEGELTLAEAEHALRDLLADGLSPAGAASVLLGAGAPPSWVRLRVSRLNRRGW
jgi:hypothetical protein